MMNWGYFTHFHESALCYTDVHVYHATSQRVFNSLRPRHLSLDHPWELQRKWLLQMITHTCWSNLKFLITSPYPFAMKLYINVTHVPNYQPDIFNCQQNNTLSRKKILFTAMTMMFQQVHM